MAYCPRFIFTEKELAIKLAYKENILARKMHESNIIFEDKFSYLSVEHIQVKRNQFGIEVEMQTVSFANMSRWTPVHKYRQVSSVLCRLLYVGTNFVLKSIFLQKKGT